MLAYYGYTALIWIVALWVTGKHTFVMSLFEERDGLLEKAMMGMLLFLIWSFSVFFLPWFIWHHWDEYRAKIKWEKAVREDVKRKEKEDTDFDGNWGDDL